MRCRPSSRRHRLAARTRECSLRAPAPPGDDHRPPHSSDERGRFAPRARCGRDLPIAVSAASPTAAPTWLDELRTPEATPACCTSIAPIATVERGGNAETVAEPDDDVRRDRAREGRVHPERSEGEHSDPAEQGADKDDASRSEAPLDLSCDAGHHEERHVHGQPGDARLECRVALDVLEVEGDEEEHSGQARRRERRRAHWRARKTLRRKNPSGSIGCGGAPRERRRARAGRLRRQETPSVNADVQPWSSLSTSANVRQKRPADTSPAPMRSSRRAFGSRDSRTKTSVSRAPAIPTGTFIQKIADQSKALISSPPRIGPPPNPMPATVAQIPIAQARRSGWYASTRIDSESGASSAAPAPCNARNVISMPWSSRSRSRSRRS